MTNHRNHSFSPLTVKRKFRLLLESYYQAYQWLRHTIAPENPRALLDFLQTIGHVNTIKAIISNYIPSPRDRTVRPCCHPFYFKGDKNVGLLLVHGFGASPQRMKDLGLLLHQKTGYTVMGARLDGHGTSFSDMAKTDFIDWYLSLKRYYNTLSLQVEKIILIGHSMGATLSLLLASDVPVHALVSLSAPLKLHRPDAKFLPAVSWALRYWPTSRKEAKEYKERGHYIYKYRPLKCVESLFDLMDVTRARLHLVTAPVFAAVGLQDARVNKENVDLLLDNISSPIKTKKYYLKSPHYLHLGPEKDLVLQDILDFLQKVLS